MRPWDDAFKAVVDAGVPVIVYNAGGFEWAEDLGALNFVGNEEHTAGLAGGDYFGTHGVTNVLCVNTIPGSINAEDRGLAEHGGTSAQCLCLRPASAIQRPWPRQ